MNKKAQSLGSFILVFIVVIVGLSLLTAVALNTGISTTSYTQNDSLSGSTTMPASGSRIDLTGQDLLSTPVVVNVTGSGTVTASNYTIDTIVSTSTGVKTVSLLSNGGWWEGEEINISYIYGPEGYANDAGTRGVISIIVIFFVLGIAVVVLEPTLRSGVLEMINR